VVVAAAVCAARHLLVGTCTLPSRHLLRARVSVRVRVRVRARARARVRVRVRVMVTVRVTALAPPLQGEV